MQLVPRWLFCGWTPAAPVQEARDRTVIHHFVLQRIYADFTPFPELPHIPLTPVCAIFCNIQMQENVMADLIYLMLGLAGFAVFAGVLRLIDRL